MNGQTIYRHGYKNGKSDGLWESWNLNERLSYQAVYKMGDLVSENSF